MLVVYLEPLINAQQQLLQSWSQSVRYWPRSYSHCELDHLAVATDWWLLFSNPLYADIWLIKYPESSRIIMTLFDN